jgi:hypothetical protein
MQRSTSKKKEIQKVFFLVFFTLATEPQKIPLFYGCRVVGLGAAAGISPLDSWSCNWSTRKTVSGR